VENDTRVQQLTDIAFTAFKAGANELALSVILGAISELQKTT
jgi:hypothetical protein